MNTETVLRTLKLPQDYAFVDGFITDYTINKSLVIVKTVDKSKSVKTVSPTGKITYTNADTTWSYQVRETRDELNNAGTYLPNRVSGFVNAPKSYLSPDDVFEIKSDRIESLPNGSWIGAGSVKVSQVDEDTVLLTISNELGASQNVIPRVFVNRVGGVANYKDPVDYLGRAIVGDLIPNQGAPESAMSIPFASRIIRVTEITNTLQGIGSWSSSNPVWSGGVKVLTSSKSVYVPVADLPSLFGKSIEQLEEETATETYCSVLNSDTHITSTSTEIVVSGDKYKGITYYSGVDAAVSKPSGKITSYNKQYPGHVNRWILKQWDAEGQPITIGMGVLGQVWMRQMASNEDSEITVIAGGRTEYDDATKTLTYDSTLPTELWYSFEELPAQGKNWGGETIIKLS